MLKYLVRKGYINVQKLLLDNYVSLGLNEQEIIIVMCLFDDIGNKQPTISTLQLAKKTGMKEELCATILNGLFNRGIVTINIEYTKSGKEKETFSLDDLLLQLEKKCFEENKANTITENENLIKQVIQLSENSFQRAINPAEIEIIIDWIESGYTVHQIKIALGKALLAKKRSMKYVDQCLLSEEKYEAIDQPIDERKSKIFNDVFRNIK